MRLGSAPLFCPADRPDRYGKAVAAADAVILDLEDAVAPGAKAAARQAIVASDLDPATTVVRLNPVWSPEFEADLVALMQTRYRTVMLAKTESSADIERLEDRAGPGGLNVIALCETPNGVRNAGSIADCTAVFAMMWGAEDLVAAIGGRSSRRADGRYRDVARYARSQVLIAAAAAGKDAFDAVHLDLSDDTGLREEASDAAASGFAGTVCIHPRQVPIVRAAYRPPAESVRWARELLAVAEMTPQGVFVHQERMIDEPVLRLARRIIAGDTA